MKKKLLKELAKLAIHTGVNIQKGQILVINAPVFTYEFVALCVKEAYLKGAKDVIVNYQDEVLGNLFYKFVKEDMLIDVPEYVVSKFDYYVENKIAALHIISPLLDINKNIDPSKMAKRSKSLGEKTKVYRKYMMSGEGQWSIIALPNQVWADKVFPNLPKRQRVNALGEAILKASRVDDKSISNWVVHNQLLHAVNKKLNDYQFDALHFRNSLGTDIIIGLADEHIWSGGADKTSKGILFNPNIPTEESFTMPHKLRVNGKVVGTMPLDHYGKLIEDFYFVFQDGKVVDFDAKKNKDVLASVFSIDEGASYIGEVALIPHDSPISKSGILYYNTLFDENASCHLALGEAYPTTTKNGANLTEDELLKRGFNKSIVHIDFMFGSSCMEIYGIKAGQGNVQIFKNGNYCI